MNARSLEKIRDAARYIAEEHEAAKVSYQHLAEPVQLAIAIIKLLKGEQQTAPEIAKKLHISSETVRQALRALKDGGIRIEIIYGNGKNAGYSLPQGKITWQEPRLENATNTRC